MSFSHLADKISPDNFILNFSCLRRMKWQKFYFDFKI